MYQLLTILLVIINLNTVLAKVDEAVVIEVRKKLKLHDMERVYADYFIRGGTKLGLNKGVMVSVVRRLPVHDPFENASVGDFKVKVADIEIIEADSEKCIGRLIEIDRQEARPMLNDDAIMLGDRLDLDTMRAKVVFNEAPSSVFETPRSPASMNQKESQSQTDRINQLDVKEEKVLEPLLTNPR
jgi:hypothetical protein